jgi:hypothetical protein
MAEAPAAWSKVLLATVEPNHQDDALRMIDEAAGRIALAEARKKARYRRLL